ncbi:MAG: sigma-54-dependent Fis family transcriptional regulator [Oscillospiraceae bacterium]
MDLQTLTEIWAEFAYEGKLDPRVQPPVAEGWRKCRAAGVNPNGGIGKRVEDDVFQSIRSANKALIDTALPIMQSVFEIVERSHFLLVLTDGAGYILEAIGDETVRVKTRDMRFVQGALWSNLSVGTNAISVALDCDTAIQMVGPEHYCRSHHGWTCSAAPIHGANGDVIGCLNLSGDASAVHDHTLGVVLAAVYGIEGQLSLLRSAEIMRAALEGSVDSILFLNDSYRPIWTNSAAKKLLGATAEDIAARDFREVMPDVNWAEQKWTDGSKYFANDVRVLSRKGTVHCSAAIYLSNDYGARTLNVTLKKQKHLIDSVNKMSGNRAIYTFDDIYTCAPEMKKTMALAQNYARYDGNILIEGESGTGKELVAQAIHNSSRASGPFVAINCASIPRDLLEAELFGYEAGAFIGAATEGNPGRFELANRGTLFLDEITEIPLEFQSKLLRAVETHSISRLGAGQEVKLDIRIIVATNRRLDQSVASGSFRQDLYYRLNVLKLDIPPLRARREDISCCAEKFLARLNASTSETQKTMSPEFLAGLTEYDWPGNVRELQNGIERAFYSCSGDVLTAQSLLLAIDRPESMSDDPLGTPPRSGEAGEIMSALAVCGGDVEGAARKLGMSRATLYRRFKKFGIDPKGSR